MESILNKNVKPSTAVQNELVKIEGLKALLDDSDALYDEHGNVDEKLLLDTIEGETDLHAMLLEIDEKIAEYETTHDAIKLRIDQLIKRKNRMKRSADTLRTIILSAMDKAGIKKIQGDLSTISVGKKAASLIINDEALIPSKYWKAEPTLDKNLLKADLKENIEIPGAEMGDEGIKLMIRRA